MTKTKMMAVFDEPENCRDCPAVLESLDYCRIARRKFAKSAKTMIDKGVPFRPGFCPLRCAPEYKMEWNGDESYEAGWNDALDVIGISER